MGPLTCELAKYLSFVRKLRYWLHCEQFLSRFLLLEFSWAYACAILQSYNQCRFTVVSL